jgi:hypothetical protein
VEVRISQREEDEVVGGLEGGKVHGAGHGSPPCLNRYK